VRDGLKGSGVDKASNAAPSPARIRARGQNAAVCETRAPASVGKSSRDAALALKLAYMTDRAHSAERGTPDDTGRATASTFATATEPT
jgi:hypothetical protein